MFTRLPAPVALTAVVVRSLVAGCGPISSMYLGTLGQNRGSTGLLQTLKSHWFFEESRRDQEEL